MLKWYLGIYIFIEYLKCVWKSNCIRIIQNNSKKKKEDRLPWSGFGLQVGSGMVEWAVTFSFLECSFYSSMHPALPQLQSSY